MDNKDLVKNNNVLSEWANDWSDSKKTKIKSKSITGRLSFFIFNLFLWAIYFFILWINGITEIFNNPEIWINFKYISSFLVFIYFGWLTFFSIYTVISFSKLRNNAIWLGKMILILWFFMDLISYIFFKLVWIWISAISLIFSWSIVFAWFSYLTKSKQVNFLFPENDRKLKKFDYILFFILILIHIIQYSLLFYL